MCYGCNIKYKDVSSQIWSVVRSGGNGWTAMCNTFIEAYRLGLLLLVFYYVWHLAFQYQITETQNFVIDLKCGTETLP